MREDKCEGCDGSGVRAPALPSCRIEVPRGWTIVERCDTCELFESDLAAAQARFRYARWVICANGGEHAIGRRPRVTRRLPGRS